MSSSIPLRPCNRSSNKTSNRAALILAAVACAPTLMGARAAHAASGIWSNTTSGGLWSSSSNWSGGTIADGAGFSADFSTLSLSGSNTVHLDSPRTIGTLNFGDTSNPPNGQFGWTLDSNGSLTNVLTLQTGTGTPSINVVNQTTTISAPIAGTQGFTKTGPGNLLLTGANTYGGVTNISNGTLILGAAASTGSPAAGAVLDIDPTLSTIVTNGSGQVTSISDLANSGDTITASALGGPTVASINGHKALAFANSGLLTSFTSGTNPATVFAIVYPSSVTDGGIVGSNNTNGLLFRINGGNLDMVQNGLNDSKVGTTTYYSNGSVPTGTPTVVALTFNSSAGTYYINGTSQGSTGTTALGVGGSNKLTIGYQYSYSSYNDEFQGDIGTILEYSRVLSAQDMATTLSFLQQEYASPSSVTGTSLVNLGSSSGSLSIANSTQAISSLSGVLNSNVYLGGAILTVGSDNTSTTYAGNISDTGPGTTATGGQLVKTGSGQLTLSGAVGNTGGLQVNAGSVLISGTYNSTGGTSVNAGSLSITGTDSSAGANIVTGGTFNISGTQSTTGAFTVNSGGTLILGGASTATGPVTVNSSGTPQLVSDSANFNSTSGISTAFGTPTNPTTLALSFTFNNNATLQLRGDNTATFANANISGGTGNSTLTFDVNSLSGTTSNQTLGIGGFETYNTTINVNGGNNYTLAIGNIRNDNSTTLTLNASTGNLAIPGGITGAGVVAVNGPMNTSLGAITGTSGSISKTGAGMLTLTGSNTYPGSTNIAGGSLVLAPGASLGNTSGISIASGAKLDVTNNPSFALLSSATLGGSGTIAGNYNHVSGTLSPGGTGTVGTLSVNGQLTLGGGTLRLDLTGGNTSTGGIYNDLINVTGNVDLTGTTLLTVVPSVTPAIGAVYSVINSSGGSIVTDGGPHLVAPSRAFAVSNTANAVLLTYTGGAAANLVWAGNVNSNWDNVTTPNWNNSGASDLFYSADNVSFTDSPSNLNVSISGTVLPGSVLVNSNTNNFNFNGSGSISGSTGLVKSGSSILTIGTANTYTGTTNISQGTVILTNTTGSGLGTGPLIIGSGATVQVGDGGNDGAIANSTTITDNGILAYNSSSTTLNPPVQITGTGSLFINATIGIGNHNTYTGGTNIAGGVVTAYEFDSFGTTGLVTINGGELFNAAGAHFLNNFNLSGTAIHIGGGNTTTFGGATYLLANTTVDLDGGTNIVFGGNVSSGTNANLFATNAGRTVTFNGNVSLGTGQINTSNHVVFAPTGTTTISSGITGGADVRLSTTGTTILSGSNSYTGGTTVSAGTLVLASANAFPASTPLTVASGTTLQVSTSSGNVSYVPTLSSLSNTGVIDLTNNSMVIQNANASIGTLFNEAKAGYNGGGWNGSGSSVILSTTAAADPTHLTAVGIATGLASFQGAGGSLAVGAGDVVLKYTYYGDANLDGQVNTADYTLIDSGYLSGTLTGWQNGDFNYDGVINGSDYTLIDNAFNTQGAQLLSQIANPTAQVAGTGTSSAVPEPATLGLLAFGTAALLGRRRNRHVARGH